MPTCMLRATFCVLIGILVGVYPCVVKAEKYTYQFSGMVVHVFGDPPATPFGEVITPFSPVTGGFTYESNMDNALPIIDCDDCGSYRHEQTNGFWATFGDLRLQADEYVVEVRNNQPSIAHGIVDVLSISFISLPFPGLTKTWQVNGSPENEGTLRIDFIAHSNTLFDDSSLPENLNPADFNLTASTNIMGDTEQPDLLFATFTLSAATYLDSDHDLDADVDGRDFLIWQQNAGLNTNSGDANSDVHVDGQDLEIWHSQYGTSSLLSAHAVPEPMSAILLIGLCATINLQRQRFFR